MSCAHEYSKDNIQMLRDGKTDRVQCLKGCGHTADLQEINTDHPETKKKFVPEFGGKNKKDESE